MSSQIVMTSPQKRPKTAIPYVNQIQERTNNEIAIQIEVINDVLDELRTAQSRPRTPIGFKND